MPETHEKAGTSILIEKLQQAGCFPHPVTQIQLIETHISWVLLTGDYAYKIKKPLNLGFLDFSTLALRQRCCDEELRLNRRFAPQIYLEVVPITGDTESPQVSGDGSAIEYTVKMRQFPQEALASALLASGNLASSELESFAGELATIHRAAAATDAGSTFGTPSAILDAAIQNFDQLSPLLSGPDDATAMAALRAWTVAEHDARKSLMEQRRVGGAVREGHGDLHLGNIVRIDKQLVPFDCIEFNPALRWNDVLSETAFLVMDLHDRGRPDLGWLFLNAWLDASGDHESIALLPFYLVYRAMVRAKVHALRARQSGVAADESARLMNECRRYLDLAQQFSRPPPPALIITHGLSGSGKSQVAAEVMQQLGAIRIRSDIERKRMHGLPSSADTDSGVAAGIYSAGATRQLYHQLADLARKILDAGQTVIVDATFLQRRQRDLLRKVASACAVPFLIVSVTASKEILCDRIRQRRVAGGDPSEADVAVLENQLATQELLTADELKSTVELPSAQLTPAACCERVIGALRARHQTNM
ncbi:MAG: AAA family ATPase [Betaproteobacteria bacterium]|nr:AAA family ATPase [Betaproteobacteria bacterium]